MARMQEAIATLQEAMRRQAEQEKENAELANRQAKMRESIKGAAAEYVCPLTLELLVDPVVAKDGRIYERSHILAWLSRNATSPLTREPMGTELTPVPLIRNSIEKLVSSGAIEDDIAKAWQKKLKQETKVKEMRAKAEGGDGQAMWLLGKWYEHGVNGLLIDDANLRVVRAQRGGPRPQRAGGFWSMSPGWRTWRWWAPGQRARARERDRGGAPRFGPRRVLAWQRIFRRRVWSAGGPQASAVLAEEGREWRVRIQAPVP